MGQDQGYLPGREGHVGATAKDNRLFVEGFFIVIALVFPGETCRNVLATLSRFTPDFRAGPRAAYGRRSSRCWRKMRTRSLTTAFMLQRPQHSIRGIFRPQPTAAARRQRPLGCFCILPGRDETYLPALQRVISGGSDSAIHARVDRR
jgi:hypothetical protein